MPGQPDAEELDDRPIENPGGIPGTADPGARAQLAAALENLPIAGITRRRVAWIVATAITAWVVLVFARQVGEASAAQAQVNALEQSNAALAANVGALGRELQVVQQQSFVLQLARAYRLGSPTERPFELAPDAPPLPSNAPGSEAVRLGASERHESPLESWLSLLFGPAPDR